MSTSKSLALIRRARDGLIEDCYYGLSPTLTSISVLCIILTSMAAWREDDRDAYIY